jgi:hypothetical protein
MSEYFHVVPSNDLYKHLEDKLGRCDCNPECHLLPITGNVLIIHNAWNGREIFEELDRPARTP